VRILSLYFGHDSSICLLRDGVVETVVEKERMTRRKHDHGPVEIDSILQKHGWSRDSIDLVVINPYVWTHNDEHLSRGFDITGPTFAEREDYLTPSLRPPITQRYSQHTIRIGGRSYPCIAVDHHLSHLAVGFFTSPFEEATTVSVDGGGDFRNIAAARGVANKLEDLQYGWGAGLAGAEANIGRVWSATGVNHFGYDRYEAAGKLMGLASYGVPRTSIVDELRNMAYGERFGPLTVGSLWRHSLLDSHSSEAQDLAASLQQFTTQELLRGAEQVSARFSQKNLTLSGGCSLNCLANTAVDQAGLFERTWVPPQPGDGGLALGQALFVWFHILDNPRSPEPLSPYLGRSVGDIVDERTLGLVVDALEAGNLVGICTGAAESGPRALGNRSILADPRLPAVRNRINNQIKRREWYRPLAPMVLGEDFAQHFEPWVPSPHMSYVTNVVNENLPAITHVDKTTRPQVVDATETSFARRVLEQWRARTGLGVLLNTSFNVQEPLVDSVRDAEVTFKRSGLDCLATPEGFLVK
jgi:carbamoyltransferase